MLDGDKCDGLCQFPTRIIDIQRDLTGERLSTTMLHEKIHAIIFEYGLDKFLTIDQQEKICDALESELTDT